MAYLRCKFDWQLQDEFDDSYFWQLILSEFIPYLGVVSQICIWDLPWKHQHTTRWRLFSRLWNRHYFSWERQPLPPLFTLTPQTEVGFQKTKELGFDHIELVYVCVCGTKPAFDHITKCRGAIHNVRHSNIPTFVCTLQMLTENYREQD